MVRRFKSIGFLRRTEDLPLFLVFALLIVSRAARADDTAPEQGKVQVPDASVLKDESATILDIYKNDFTQAKKLDERAVLAKKLLQAGQETSKDLNGRYALLIKARDIGAESGDVETAFGAADEISKGYEVDAVKLTADLVKLD